MTTLTEARQTETIGDGLPGPAELTVVNGRTIIEGAQVGLTAAGLATDAAAGTAIAYVGKALHTVVGDGTRKLRYQPGVHAWENSSGDPLAAANAGDIVYGEDDETVAATSASGAPAGVLVAFDANGPRVFQSPLLVPFMIANGSSAAALTVLLASIANGEGASMIGVEDAAGNFGAAADVEACLAAIWTLLASVANTEGASLVGVENAGGKFAGANVEACLGETALTAELAAIGAGVSGASLVGVEDAGTFTLAADVEACLAELYQHALSSRKLLPGCSLFALREVSAAGNVGNIAGGCGNLGSDTTPILRGDAAESQEVYWAAGNSDIVAAQFALPADFDDTRDVTVTLRCYQDNTNTDPANFTVESSWNGGALVVDTAAESGVSGVEHDNVATIAAADIPAGARRLTLLLTPPAHAADGIGLVEVRVEYGAKLQTS